MLHCKSQAWVLVLVGFSSGTIYPEIVILGLWHCINANATGLFSERAPARIENRISITPHVTTTCHPYDFLGLLPDGSGLRCSGHLYTKPAEPEIPIRYTLL